ncbi:transmembrane protein 272-like isoform X2 [Anolis carolinensis]|uniref:transmembrane protein 272-like isoform X2 n=1 Tax=Anolis carolinensis TaxID=28377 RepID=UPI002F2B2AED
MRPDRRPCPPGRPFCPRSRAPSSSSFFFFRRREMDEEAQQPLLVAAAEDTPSHRALKGALYLEQCPRQPLVPIYLLVLSAVSLLLLLLGCVSCEEGASEWPRTLVHHLRVTCLLFLCAWFIAGSVWVYSIYPPDFEEKGDPGRGFCQRTLFLFAFGVTTALHVALAVALLFSLCLLGAVFLFGALLPHGGHGDRGGA